MTWPSLAVTSSGQAVLASALAMTAIVIKYVVEKSRSQLQFNGPGSYSYSTRVAVQPWRARLFRFYRLTFHLRPVLAILLPLTPLVVGTALAASFVAEMFVLFRYHLVLLTALCGLFVSLAPTVQSGWYLLVSGYGLNFSEHITAPGVPFLQVLMAAMYSLSAVRKWRNGFANGRVLSYGLVISLSQRRYPDHLWGGRQLLRLADRLFPWPLTAKVVIAVEFALGILLVLPWHTVNLVGIALAVPMQMSFTLLFPRTLLPFTLAVIGTLILWL